MFTIRRAGACSLLVAGFCLAVISVSGCRPKPVSGSKDATKTSEGPKLAPPQQAAPAGTPQTDQAAPPTTGDSALKEHRTTGPKPAAEDAAEAEKIKANLAALTATDRSIAEKQKICPVSGELLGAMGTPKKIQVAGHDVFICCPSCEEPLTNDPTKYLAKIGLQPNK